MKQKDLIKEYANQDNRATAWPIFITVQELTPVGVIADGHSLLSEEGEISYEHDCNLCQVYPCWNEDNEEEPEHCSKDIRIGYLWMNIEFFLTIRGAEEFIKADKHNHGKLRTYVKHFNRRNYEMRNLLEEIGFKIKD